ncbi:hypothetical protein DLD82_15515 [Methanospirillum stamsii]|uniref:Uncharacterized protein n=1 Tax=Methanospirillum stamsii TaxID=1277351 RepID=A0A2V2MSU1_9EURY|nr:hypothetical protein DLD82_15515 [Methanospirillum stamsii]
MAEKVQNGETHVHSEITVFSEGCDYPCIKAAINGSLDGDRIFVSEGTYPESLVVNESMDIRGVNGTVIVRTSDHEVAIAMTSDCVFPRCSD